MAADPDDSVVRKERRELQMRVKLLKETLSTKPQMRSALPGVRDQVTLTVTEYNELIRDHVEDSVAELEDTIAEAGLEPAEITTIFRIGGAARTPLVTSTLDRLRLPVLVEDNPKLVVARGGALLAHRHLNTSPPPPPTPTPQPPAPAQSPPVSPPESEAGGERIVEPEGHQTLAASPQEPGGARPSATTGWGKFISKINEKVEEGRKGLEETQTGRPLAEIDADLTRLGIDPATACRSRLSLSSSRSARTEVTLASLTVANDLAVTVRPMLGTFGGSLRDYVGRIQQRNQSQGWHVYLPEDASLPGMPGDRQIKQWMARSFPDGGSQMLLNCYAAQAPYVVEAWFDQSHAHYHASMYVDVPGRVAAMANKWSASARVSLVVAGCQRSFETIQANTKVAGKRATLTAELFPVGTDIAEITEGRIAALTNRAGKNRILINGDDEVFFSGVPCRVFRVECDQRDQSPAHAHEAPTTHWLWAGELDGRVATVQVHTQDPGLHPETARDLAHLDTTTR